MRNIERTFQSIVNYTVQKVTHFLGHRTSSMLDPVKIFNKTIKFFSGNLFNPRTQQKDVPSLFSMRPFSEIYRLLRCWKVIVEIRNMVHWERRNPHTLWETRDRLGKCSHQKHRARLKGMGSGIQNGTSFWANIAIKYQALIQQSCSFTSTNQ